MKKTGWILLIIIGFWRCSTERQPPAPVFYYWKTAFAISPNERAYLDSVSTGTLFIKFADIARDPSSGEVEPYSLLQVTDTSNTAGLQFVPCFFITNSVFQNNDNGIWLSERLLETLESVGEQFGKKPAQWPEIQIDCDWTAGTRDNFFHFLTELKKRLAPATILNVTIRLHQYKYPDKTGVPPADKGVLMCYNTGDIDAEKTSNSILNVEDAAPYFQNTVPYPIPLDLALPVFSWALVYRDEELWRIIPESEPGQWADTAFFEPSGAMVRVKKPTFRGGHYLRSGDLIRLESVTPEILEAAIPLLQSVRPVTGERVLFYHLDSAAIGRFPEGTISDFCKKL